MIQLTILTATTFGDWSYLAVNKHFAKAIKHESEVIKDEDPEELHQMRVGVRRLRSAIAGFAPALSLPKGAQDKNLGKIGRILGILRDLDVLKETLTQKYLPQLPETEQLVLTQSLKTLEKRRHKALKRVRKLFEDKLYYNFKQDLELWLVEPQYQPIASINIYLILADLLLPEISRLLLHPGWLVGVRFDGNQVIFTENREQILYLQAETLHDLRKEAKRTRYLLELFTHFYGEQYQSYLQDIKSIQDILGEVQDSFVLGEFLTGALKLDWRKEIPTLVELITVNRQKRYDAWGELQQKFLSLEVRKHFHTTIEQPNVNLEENHL